MIIFSKFQYLLPVLLLSALIVSNKAFAQVRNVPQSQAQIQLSFAPVVKQVAPSVVNIYTKRTVSKKARSPFFSDPFFAPFFRDDFFGGRMRQQVESSLGSGVIVDANGLVVTNAHVVRGATEIRVVLNDGREFPAELALSDEPSDLALLRIENDGEALPFVNLKPSESLEVGDIVLAVGNPFGVGQTVTSGIVSALARSSLNVNDFNFFIQTDAAINPGNSGGPLVALDGGVVGINTAIYSRDGGSLGIGFAIPSEMVATVIAAEKNGRMGQDGVVRPWLGVSAQDVTPDIANSLELDKPWGVLIAELHPSSPLLEAGLRVGDVVQTVNERQIRGAAEMKFRMATVPLGREASFIIARNGQNMGFSVTAMAPPDDPDREETLIEGGTPLDGATVVNLNPAVSVEVGLSAVSTEEGVVVYDVEPRSPASRLLNAGAQLLEINGKEIEDVGDVERALKRPVSNGWSIVTRANGRTQQLFIR